MYVTGTGDQKRREAVGVPNGLCMTLCTKDLLDVVPPRIIGIKVACGQLSEEIPDYL